MSALPARAQLCSDSGISESFKDDLFLLHTPIYNSSTTVPQV